MMRAGFVYILTNPGLPGYVKIGRTTRETSIRADELRRQYGTLHPFEVHSKQMVNDCTAVETLAHRSLYWARVPRSELFKCDPATAQKAIRQATILTLERPWHVRLWHWIILPRPERAHNAGGGRGSYRRNRPWPLLLVAVAVLCFWFLRHYRPALADWLPAGSLSRTIARAESW